ncbi:MAG: GNAT family N-acetyltransferase [Clostridia bacterium]|nr:GNAT family N-acetyltransferase [Clostridia bacterium]
MEAALRLTLPTAEHREEISAYRQEFLDSGDSMDGTGALRRLADPVEWLAATEQCRSGENVPSGWVQATQFLCVRETDGRVVGMIQVRHRFSPFLKEYGGHIGYSVRPSERRKGYAAWMLNAVKPFCRSIGLSAILVTCLAGNEASRRTILKNGGVYDTTVHEPVENEDIERYWISLEE